MAESGFAGAEKGDAASGEEVASHGTVALAFGALGIVYGDIGTSPIYALRETIRAAAGTAIPNETDILGALSIIVWALTLVVTVKYAIFVLRADNHGEGGTLSIMTLARSVAGKHAVLVGLLGMAGASLFFGDAVVTPAISVLSAVEGLHVAAPGIAHYVVPITVVILVGLFAAQSFGTGRVSAVFGPVTLIWFLTLAAAGAIHLADDLTVFRALNPWHAVTFVAQHGAVAVAVIGAAFLAVTGAEALYVDLGHFGKKPILLAWYSVVFPCLLINYFGQGAYLLAADKSVGQPLFEMAPAWATMPMVILATLATVIASQAVISGAFSLTRQAIQLRLLPRMTVIHTSETQAGQIYLPQMNWMMLTGVLLLVLAFGSSESLAAAYGISVSGEMLVTTLLLFVVIRRIWKWSPAAAGALTLLFLAVDVMFLGANSSKFLDGGWVSVTIAVLIFIIMRTWTEGSNFLFEKTRKAEIATEELVAQLARDMPPTVPGTAVFLTSDKESAPTSLLHSLKHYKVLHEQNVILTVETMPQPHVGDDERAELHRLTDHVVQVTLRFGYMQDPNVPKALWRCREKGLKFDIMSTSFFLSRRSLRASKAVGMSVWRDRIYIFLARNSVDATRYFRLPSDRIVEIGTQVTI